MKVNRMINDCYCDNCRKYEECRASGLFDEERGMDFCIDYEDETYPDDESNDEMIEV